MEVQAQPIQRRKPYKQGPQGAYQSSIQLMISRGSKCLTFAGNQQPVLLFYWVRSEPIQRQNPSDRALRKLATPQDNLWSIGARSVSFSLVANNGRDVIATKR